MKHGVNMAPRSRMVETDDEDLSDLPAKRRRRDLKKSFRGRPLGKENLEKSWKSN